MEPNTGPTAPPAAGTYVPTPDGGRLWAESSGSGSPVVLLHGAGMDSRLWDTVAPGLARRHRVVRFDARGLGRSFAPERPFSDVEDLRSVLDHFGLRRAALVGLSMGGETALDFALAYPGRVAALGLVCSSVGGHDWPQDAGSTAYDTARREGDAEALARLELSVWAPMGRTAPGGELIEAMVADNAHRRLVSERYMAPPPNPDAEAHLGDIAVPTLVVHGDRDHAEIGVIVRRLAGGIPGARGHLVPDADHYLPLRTPGRLAELLLEHLP
ncbi:Arylesterase [Nocardiopsis dassonvillei]|uniref:alpha/beta fold hydrolase n=1 Tax=Nocardiopsis dassonvillei TaxID=2014 RepID=UPI003F56F4A0